MTAREPAAGPSYPDLLRRLETATTRLGGSIESIGAPEGDPVMQIELGTAAAPALWIDAGLHGEEPASPLGFAAWLEEDAARWAPHLRVTALPCLNPWGFARGLRRGRDAEDPNRQFDDPAAPLTRLVLAALGGRRYPLAMDLHEDSDFTDAYAYELKEGPPWLAERVLAAFAARGVARSHGAAVGPFMTDQGLLRRKVDAAARRARQGWPIAFLLTDRATDHLVTIETPGRLDLAVRIALQRAALNEAAAFLTGLPSGGLPGIE